MRGGCTSERLGFGWSRTLCGDHESSGGLVNVSESLFFEIAVICTLASQFFVVLVGMAFVVCLITAAAFEAWAVVRRLSGRRDRMLPPRQTAPGRPWTVPANQLAQAHR